jgi:alpha-L-arabinofuranosidase
VVNPGEKITSASIQISGYSPAHSTVDIDVLSGSLDASNTATMRRQIQPVHQQWLPVFNNHETKYDFPPHSLTVLKFK